MDKYTETAFLVIALGVLGTSAIMAMRLAKIQRELRLWHKEWKASRSQGSTAYDEKED